MVRMGSGVQQSLHGGVTALFHSPQKSSHVTRQGTGVHISTVLQEQQSHVVVASEGRTDQRSNSILKGQLFRHRIVILKYGQKN